jgi:hypothetical protein
MPRPTVTPPVGPPHTRTNPTQHLHRLAPAADRIAAVEVAEQLAPELATGEAVQYHGPSGQSVQATIAEIDLSHWCVGGVVCVSVWVWVC